ncbi:MAG TPA: hypothetical protein VF975_05100, partial [Thermoanaerobaculia bacterium]
MRKLRFAAFVACAFLSVVSASAELTGTWNGTYTGTATACTPPRQTSGNLSASLVQNGDSVSGSMVLEVSLIDCQTVSPPLPVGMPVSGTVNGNSFTLQFVLNIPGGPLGGVVSGSISG